MNIYRGTPIDLFTEIQVERIARKLRSIRNSNALGQSLINLI